MATIVLTPSGTYKALVRMRGWSTVKPFRPNSHKPASTNAGAIQIVSILKQAELRMSVADTIHQVGISEQTFYRWKKQYAGLQF